jgi:hypothetical protein
MAQADPRKGEEQVIKCNRTKAKLGGIIWSKLTPEKVSDIVQIQI